MYLAISASGNSSQHTSPNKRGLINLDGRTNLF